MFNSSERQKSLTQLVQRAALVRKKAQDSTTSLDGITQVLKQMVSACPSSSSTTGKPIDTILLSTPDTLKAYNVSVLLCANRQCPNTTITGENLKRCANCKTVSYCDKTCQRTHWSLHKPFCTSIHNTFSR